MDDAKLSAGRIAAIILAAGESKRMGEENKLLLPLHGRPMITHVVEAIVQASAKERALGECIVVLGHEADVVKEVLSSYPVRFTVNERYRDGMGASINAGVQAAHDAAMGYMICLSDMPLITSIEYTLLASYFCDCYAIDQQAIVVPTFKEQRGNPVFLSSWYKPAILANSGALGCRNIVKNHPSHVFYRAMESNHVLRDVDTQASFETLL